MDYMNKITTIAGLTGILILLLAIGNVYWENPEQRYESTREMMDTYISIMIYHNDEDEAKEIIDDAFIRMEDIIGIANRFNITSEVYQLNTNGFIEDPSPELLDMIQKSIDYWDITGGAFDITIMPLLNLWDPSSGSGPYDLFGMDLSYMDTLDSGIVSEEVRTQFSDHEYLLNETPTLMIIDPGQGWILQSGGAEYTITNTSSELTLSTQAFWNVNETQQDEIIDQTKQFIGSNRITISQENISLEPGMCITLDGIAKGYIVDAALQVLVDEGIERALIDAGGDIATLGHKPEGKSWVVGLRNPEDKDDTLMEFGLEGEAIATSGNYERYFDENKSVGHIMDPKTGRSVFKASSATVIADNCTVADILATALFVLGPVDGIELVNTLPNVEALLLGYDDPGEVYSSTALNKYSRDDVLLMQIG